MKKVLFITYYWPPSGKASLQWPLKISKHLPSLGWMPSVLTVDEDTFTQKDETFLTEIPRNVNVIKARSYEPFDIYKRFIGKRKDDQLVASETISNENRGFAHRLSIWIRMNIFIPDARVGWYFPAVKNGAKYLSNEKVEAIISIGPPHTTHLVGKKLSSQFKIPHIPVLIDPWVDISYYKNFKRSRITLSIDNRFEKSVLENARKIVFVTETMKADYVKKYPFIKEKSNVLYWGFSEEDFNLSPRMSTRKASDEEIILHAGNIFDHQNPKYFWQTIRNEIDKGKKLKIVFIDPWVDISYYKNFKRGRITLSIDNRFEKSVLENAGKIVFVTETMKADYMKKYPFIKEKSNVLYWGFSEEDFNLSSSMPTRKASDEEIILHAGNIFDHQDPKHFWQTLRNEINKGKNLKVVFIGTVSPDIRQSIKNSGLDQHTEYKGFLPYREMLNEMMKASYLLVCATEPRHVPGKLFEYLRAGKPIIAFGNGNEEVKGILIEANAGMIFGYNESGEEFFRTSKQFSSDQNYIRKFERKLISSRLSEILSQIV